MMKKLFSWIFAKPKEEPKREWCSYTTGEKVYDDFHEYMKGLRDE